MRPARSFEGSNGSALVASAADSPRPWQRRSYLEATARARIDGIVDPGSFIESLPPADRVTSPHLAAFDLPVAFDDGVVIGRGSLAGRRVLIAAQEGRFNGGSVGEVHGAKIAGLLARALRERPDAVVLLLESGGVRLQEANAGLIAVSEIIRAILTARSAGIRVIAAIGGAYGCFGGMGIAAACCAAIVMSEEGRLGLSGPEVIETANGVEEFDADDRALVWRTVGGRHRHLLGDCTEIVDDDVAAFRASIARAIDTVAPLTPDAMSCEHALLAERLEARGAPAPPTHSGAWRDIADRLFPQGHDIMQDDDVLTGSGTCGELAFAVTGTADHAETGVEVCLAMAARVLQTVRDHPGRPIMFLVDTRGQRLRRRDESLGIHRYMAHVAACVEVARMRGHAVIGLVYDQALSGGILASGMSADVCGALPSAQIHVMNLTAMARVTRIAETHLRELARTSLAFAPGAASFVAMGAIDSLWEGDIAQCLRRALDAAGPRDERSKVGRDRGGRLLAHPVAQRVAQDG